MKNLLQVFTVKKRFGQREILKDVHFKIEQGEILAIFGRNGCGKSTLLKILFGTLKAETVDLHINQSPISPINVISKGLIGYLPQDNFLPKHMKVRDVIPLFYEDGDAQDFIFRAPFVEKIAKQKIGTLSLGEQRYLELLLVAHLNHPFLLLDEPFSMIEPLYKEAIKELLLSLKAKKGILLTDHYYHDVLEIADRKLLVTDGVSQSIVSMEQLRELGYLKKELA